MTRDERRRSSGARVGPAGACSDERGPREDGGHLGRMDRVAHRIRERRIAGDDEFMSQFADARGRKGARVGRDPASGVDLSICATVTPDMPIPATACIVRTAGATDAAAFDLARAAPVSSTACVRSAFVASRGLPCRSGESGRNPVEIQRTGVTDDLRLFGRCGAGGADTRRGAIGVLASPCTPTAAWPTSSTCRRRNT